MAKSTRMSGTTGRRMLRRLTLLSLGVALPLGWLMTAPAEAVPQQPDSGPHATVGDSAEAWYASSAVDICTTPLGCPPQQVPTSPYPADTLHVGAAGGRETARTYLLPDLFALPVGATATGGVMTLPVDTASTDGTVSADRAQLRACLVTKAFTDGTAGSSAPPPATDCATSARPVYDAEKSVFTLDLTPFLKAWASGQLPLGIAVVPDASRIGPTDAWHVTINGRKPAGRPHVTSVITYTKPASAPVADSGTTTTPAPPVTSAGNPPPVSVPSVPAGIAPPAAAPPVVAPSQQPAQVAQQPVAYSRSFQYPLAFLAPIALLIGGVFFARLFTRDPAPRRVIVR